MHKLRFEVINMEEELTKSYITMPAGFKANGVSAGMKCSDPANINESTPKYAVPTSLRGTHSLDQLTLLRTKAKQGASSLTARLLTQALARSVSRMLQKSLRPLLPCSAVILLRSLQLQRA